MADKTLTKVALLGKEYNLSGYADEVYLQRLATYVNGKQAELKKTQGFLRKNADFQQMMLAINLADDYFKEQARSLELEVRVEKLEKEIYNLRHALVQNHIKNEDAEG